MDEIVNIIKEYIRDMYFIGRLKDGKSKNFKRGIVIDNDTIIYMLNNDRSEIRKKVYDSIKRIFYVDDHIINEAMRDFLNKK